MLRKLLICGLAAGACAGLLATGFVSLVGEPAIDRAVAYEHAHERSAHSAVVRSRRRDSSTRERLTPRELQVGLVVAQGATNREAAASLFLTPKTIEFHLGRVYRKLDIRSRVELAALAAKGRLGAPG